MRRITESSSTLNSAPLPTLFFLAYPVPHSNSRLDHWFCFDPSRTITKPCRSCNSRPPAHSAAGAPSHRHRRRRWQSLWLFYNFIPFTRKSRKQGARWLNWQCRFHWQKARRRLRWSIFCGQPAGSPACILMHLHLRRPSIGVNCSSLMLPISRSQRT